MHGIIFDCDGVLVDSEPVSCKASSTVLQKYGVNISPEEMAADFTGKSEKQMVLEIGQKHQISFPMGILDEIQDLYFELAAELQPMPGLVGILDLLRKHNIPMGIASSGTPERIDFSLKVTGLDRYFAVRCSASEVTHGKPAPDLFLLTAARIGIAPENCLVVEDSVFGIQGAKAAGMKAAGYTSSHAAELLLKSGADFIFDDYEHFLPIMKAFSQRWHFLPQSAERQNECR
jgi:HAD superfamily hydrolase (TIGR01509 family)